MSDPDVVVTLHWVTVCHECEHRHVDEHHAHQGEEFAPPPVPSKCDQCERSLRGDSWKYSQMYVVEDVQTFGRGGDL